MNHAMRKKRSGERGISLLELTFSTVTLVVATFATIDFGRMLWVHNALNEQARKGTQYAASHSTTSATVTAIKNLVVYNNVNGGTRPVVPGLTTAMVTVDYNSMSMGAGTTTVKVSGYTYRMASLMGVTVSMPTYKMTLTGETAGNMPGDLASPTF
jgi:hypothetical protein